jgi:hypothetical protein
VVILPVKLTIASYASSGLLSRDNEPIKRADPFPYSSNTAPSERTKSDPRDPRESVSRVVLLARAGSTVEAWLQCGNFKQPGPIIDCTEKPGVIVFEKAGSKRSVVSTIRRCEIQGKS